MKNTMDSGLPVWQLPISEDILHGKSNYVSIRSKYHCFISGHSLCKMWWQVTDHFETDIGVSELLADQTRACKRCLQKYKNIMQRHNREEISNE